MAIGNSNISNWLKAEQIGNDLFKTEFQIHHLGNVFIRSLHGGVSGAMAELSAQAIVAGEVEDGAELSISSSSIDYLRITKDADLFARASIQRISRRIAFVQVSCWQDAEEIPVAHGIITIKINRPDTN